MTFETSYEKILDKIEQVDPIAYYKTRNHVDGAVSYLSPYISRGVISTRFVYEKLLARGFKFYEIEKFVQELSWRDYWQQVWIAKGEGVNEDLKHTQEDVSHQQIPDAILNATTGVEAIDKGLGNFYESGYMHNHMRMYVASLACNLGKSHWLSPARWMYYYLLDGDWASNALSWQWVAGANANKKYYANQENINTFFKSNQNCTFLDVSYEELNSMKCPEVLSNNSLPKLKTILPDKDSININSEIPTLIYNYYNLDPLWRKEENTNKILLLEQDVFDRYPVSDKSLEFALKLASNIKGLQVFTGSFVELKEKTGNSEIIYKEHPLNNHFSGTEDLRDWIFGVTGFFPSFFGYWKKCKKEIRKN